MEEQEVSIVGESITLDGGDENRRPPSSNAGQEVNIVHVENKAGGRKKDMETPK